MTQKKYYIFFTIFLAFFSLFFVAKTVFAVAVVDEIPSSDSALSAIEEISAPVLKQLADTLLAMIKSVAWLFASSYLLDWAMNAPIDLGDELVTTGWTFTLALTNLIFIFVILYIAIKQIISDEGDTTSIKKYLPRLVATILLVNFGVVFVKMALDVASILQRSMIPSGARLAWNSLSLIGSQMLASFLSISAYLIVGLAASVVPIMAAAWQGLALPTALTTLAPSIIGSSIQIFVCNTLTGIYLAYAGYFIIRIFIIKILTMIFPLAFACYAIPSEGAQKLWKQWLNFFTSWVFFPIPLLFFLVLGLKLLQDITPDGLWMLNTPFAFSQILNFDLIGKAINYYIALIAYLVALGYMKVKFSPKLDIGGINAKGGIWDKGKSFVLSRIKPLASTTKQTMATSAVAYREEQKAAKVPGSEAANKWAKRGVMEKIGGALDATTVSVIEKNLQREGTTPNLEVSKRVDAQQKDYEKKFGKDTESAAKIFNSVPAWQKTSLERAAFASYLAKNTKGGKGMKETLTILGKEKTRGIINDSINAKKGDAADALKRSMIGSENYPGLSEKDYPGLSKEEAQKKIKKVQEEIEKVITETDDETKMKQLAPGFEKNAIAMEKIMDWEADQLAAATKVHRSAFLKAYADEVNKKSKEEFENFANGHSGQIMFIIGTAGQRAGAILKDKEGNARGKEDIQKILGEKNAIPDIQEDDHVSPEAARVEKDLSEREAQSNLKSRQKILERTVEETIKKYNKPKGTSSGPERSDKRPPGT